MLSVQLEKLNKLYNVDIGVVGFCNSYVYIFVSHQEKFIVSVNVFFQNFACVLRFYMCSFDKNSGEDYVIFTFSLDLRLTQMEILNKAENGAKLPKIVKQNCHRRN